MSTLTSPAKINLFLAITGKDPSGYHTIETVLARFPELADEIRIQPADTLNLTCDDPSIPTDESNTIVRAIRVLERAASRALPYDIQLTKRIPAASGLGGASSNAASVMLHINEQAELGLSPEQLQELGAKVGMDVPFFLSGHPVAHGAHFGEVIHPLQPLPPELEISIHPPIKQQATPEAFVAWDDAAIQSNADIAPMLAAIRTQNPQAILQHIHNDFELIFGRAVNHPHACLSGSGPAVVSFALADS